MSAISPARKPAPDAPDGGPAFAINDATEGRTDLDPSWRAMVNLMRSDAARAGDREDGASPLRRLYPSLLIAWSYRLAHTLWLRGLRAPAAVLMWVCHVITGAEIRPSAVIGPGLEILHSTGVVVGGGVQAGARLTLVGSNTLGANLRDGRHGSPILGDDVIVGTRSVVLGPVRVGDGAVVGAMSLVLDDVPAGAKVKGIPAA